MIGGSHEPQGSGTSDVVGLPRPSFTSIFETSPSLFLVLDPEYRIIAVTDAYLAATMTVREEIVGRHLFDVFPDNPDDLDATGVSNLRASLDRAVASRKQDTMAVQKYDVRDAAHGSEDFEVRYWSPVNTPIFHPDGSLSHIIHEAVDVTEFVKYRTQSDAQRDANDQLRDDVENMQAEILRRSAELHESNTRLRDASEAKNIFLSRMSHELRSPLTAVIGYSEFLKVDSDPDGEVSQAADAILRAGQHLLALINEVLDIARIETGDMAMSIESVSVEEVLDQVLELMRPLAERRGITIEAPGKGSDVFVLADYQRLRQVLINLVTNAIKYNVGHGSVSIDIRSDEERVRIDVSDTGHGIAAGDMSKLFQPFERLGMKSSVEGTGLGLALSQSLVEEMRGAIKVKSQVGVGSTFTIELGAAESGTRAARRAQIETDMSVLEYPEQRTLLYIEDTAENIKLVERLLSRRPQVKILPAMLGSVGIDLAREHAPDMILLDLHLPDMNGAGVLARLKADPSTRDIPVVILSADATNRQTDEVLELGAAAYMTKPIRMTRLLTTVDEFLNPKDSPT